MISYNRLWETMKKKGVSMYALKFKHHIGGGTMGRLKSGLSVSTNTLDILCEALDCELSDIAEYISNKTKNNETV